MALNINLPKDYVESEDNILFKIEKKKDKVVHQQTFLSFCLIISPSNTFTIGSKVFSIKNLYDLLIDYGLSKVIPTVINLTESGYQIQLLDFQPLSYMGPTVWYFKWDNISCSFTGKGNELYIRVHDMKLEIGETVINGIIKELLKRWKDPTPKKSLIIYDTVGDAIRGYSWYQYSTRLQRDMKTIYIHPDIKTKMSESLSKFLKSEELYDRYGITWKTIYLFHGPPGTGKTSTVLALASMFNKNIAKLSLTNDLTSVQLNRLFQSIPDNTVLLLEDVDALFTERKATGSIDFSTLINNMDGLTTKRGLIMFMTTNHVTKLDAALLRPGRVDFMVEFKPASREDLKEALKILAEGYEHEHEEFLNKSSNKGLTIAELQKYLFDCIMEEKKSIL